MDDSARPPVPRDRAFLGAVLAVQGAAAVAAAHLHRDSINPDGLAYVLNARHYLRGEFGLAVNGYWGPLFSWLTMPFLAAGMEPALAGHVVAALSSLVFTAGTHALLRAALGDVPAGRSAVRLGTLLAAAAGVTWCADTMTPDLLLAGLFALFAARLFTDAPWDRPVEGGKAGMWLGAAALAKAVALPSGLLLIAAAALASRFRDGGSWRASARTAAWTVGGAVLVVLPWIVTLSVHYGRPTWATTGPIAHSVVGPGDRVRWYPTFQTFHVPEPGRITSWEEPSLMKYETWSPFQDWTHFRHQTRVIPNNAVMISGYLKEFDAAGLGLACAILGAVLLAGSAGALGRERWRWAGVGVAAVSAPYLPVFCSGDRYFWAAYPFLLLATYGLVLHACRDGAAWARRTAIGVATASFALALGSFHVLWYPFSVPLRPSLTQALVERADVRVTSSRRAAAALQASGHKGPVHSDVREGLLVAFFADVPWHGQEEDPQLERLDEVGARTVVTKAGSPLAARLAASSAWQRFSPDDETVLSVFVRR